MLAKQSAKRESVTPKKIVPDNRATKISDDQLLYSRAQVRRLLGGLSYITVVRLEHAGRLKPVRLHPNKAKAQVYYRHRDVLALVEG